MSISGPNKEEVENYLDVLGSRGWEIINIDFRELDSRGSFAGVAKRKLDQA